MSIETYTSDEQDGSLAYSEPSRGLHPRRLIPHFSELSVFFEQFPVPQARVQDFLASLWSNTGRNQASQEVWATSKIVGRKMRGIDLICVFRPLTACVFLPGCSSILSWKKQATCCWNSITTANWNCEVKLKFAIAAGHSLDKGRRRVLSRAKKP